MRGLDPRIHPISRKHFSMEMDARIKFQVKPGHDGLFFAKLSVF